MSALDPCTRLNQNTLIRSNARPLLQVIPIRSIPMRVAVIGNHLPRQCGIATFTTDLCDAIAAEYGAAGVSVVAVNDRQSRYSYPARVRFELAEGELSSYQAAADFINSSNFDVVCLQHEYGIVDGKSGSHILRLLQNLKVPVVTTLHTVLRSRDGLSRNDDRN